MGRADAAGGEHVVVARAQRVERGDDLVLDVGDDARLAQIDAEFGEILGDIADVAVLGAARQDLVADDQHRRGDDFSLMAGALLVELVGDVFAACAGFLDSPDLRNRCSSCAPTCNRANFMMMSRGHSARGAALRNGSSTRSSAPFDVELDRVDFRIALLAHQGQQGLGAHANLLDARLGADDPHRGFALIVGIDEQRHLAVDVGERAADRLDVGEIALTDVVGEALEQRRQRLDGEDARPRARRSPPPPAHSRRRWRRCRERRSRPSAARRATPARADRNIAA